VAKLLINTTVTYCGEQQSVTAIENSYNHENNARSLSFPVRGHVMTPINSRKDHMHRGTDELMKLDLRLCSIAIMIAIYRTVVLEIAVNH